MEEHKVFVGGIPHKFLDRDLKEAFRRHNPTRATVMIDRKTGRSRGFGFVYFTDRRACDEAMERMHQVLLDGRKISVTRAVPETQTVPGTPAGVLASGRGISRVVRGGRGREARRDSDRWSNRSVQPSGRRESRGYDRYDRSLGRADRSPPGRQGRSRDGRSDRRSKRWDGHDRGQATSADSGDRDHGGVGGDSPGGDSYQDGRPSRPPPYAEVAYMFRQQPRNDDSTFEPYRAVLVEDINDYISRLDPPPTAYPMADCRLFL